MRDYEAFKVNWAVEQLCRGYVCIACGRRFAKNTGKCIALCQRCAETRRLDIVFPEYQKGHARELELHGTNYEYKRESGKTGTMNL